MFDRDHHNRIQSLLSKLNTDFLARSQCFFGGGTASVLALNEGRLFRTLNYETPDPECPVHVVARDGEQPGQSFINLNLTPQGQASAIVVRQFA